MTESRHETRPDAFPLLNVSKCVLYLLKDWEEFADLVTEIRLNLSQLPKCVRMLCLSLCTGFISLLVQQLTSYTKDIIPLCFRLCTHTYIHTPTCKHNPKGPAFHWTVAKYGFFFALNKLSEFLLPTGCSINIFPVSWALPPFIVCCALFPKSLWGIADLAVWFI